MMPVIYRFVFDTPLSHSLLYLVAAALVAYAAWSGYRGAHGGPDPKKPGDFLPAGDDEKKRRAILYGAIGLGLAWLGLYYALPEVPFIGKGKGEGIPIHSYGILVGGGFIAAVTVASWLAWREWPGEEGARKRDQVLDLAFYVFIGAMIGSRVLFILVNWKDYAAQPSKIFDLGGGLVFYGGLIGAALTAYWYAHKHDIHFLRLADIAMPTVSLGQALGRLGCFSAGCCWGDVAPHNYGLGVHFPGAAAKNLFGGPAGTSSLAYQSMSTDTRYVVEATGQVLHAPAEGAVRISDWVTQHGHTLPVHPTQLYESTGQLILFVTLLTLRGYRRFHGMIFGLWLICYAMLRSTVELFRGDVERGTLHGLLNYLGMPSLAEKVPLEAWYNMSVSQFISLCMFTLGATVLVRGAQALNAQPRVDFKALAIG
jgi:phosphatidylglycerol---prolipoprotein diacylglyceryl transferase